MGRSLLLFSPRKSWAHKKGIVDESPLPNWHDNSRIVTVTVDTMNTYYSMPLLSQV